MSSKFGYLDRLDVKSGVTADYTFFAISVNGKSPVLTVRPATEATPGYYGELLVRANRSQAIVSSGAISKAVIDDSRREDRDLFPRFIVVGWHDVVDDKGEEVPFSVENARDFLSALPDYIFDEFRKWCGQEVNFLPRGTSNIELAVDAVAGN